MNELGNVSISQEVVATIAESVISEIDGVASLVGGNAKNEIVKFFQNVSSGGKGIEVEVQEVNVFIQKVVKEEKPVEETPAITETAE